MKKVQSLILALIMAAGLMFSAVPANAEDLGLDGNYTIVDTCYRGGDSPLYVALAKSFGSNATSATSTPARVYTSEDGITWIKAKDFTNMYNQANFKSRQCIVWWEAAQLFVIVGINTGSDGKTYKLYASENAKDWKSITTSYGANSPTVSVDGNMLMVTGNRATQLFTSEQFKAAYAAGSSAATPTSYIYVSNTNVWAYANGLTTEENGKRKYIHLTNQQQWVTDGSTKIVQENGADKTYFVCESNGVVYESDSSVAATPYDTAYLKGIKAWVTINGTGNAYMFDASGETVSKGTAISLPDSKEITGIGYDSGLVLFGCSDGTLYYAEENSGINNAQAWKQASGTMQGGEVRSISSIGNNQFLVATETKVYRATKKSDSLVCETFGAQSIIGTPTVSSTQKAEAVFDGTKLLGGAYSPVMNNYVVYGNTTDGRGKVYLSNNGLNWKEVYISDNAFVEDSTNAAVWWTAGQNAVTYTEDGVEKTADGAYVISTSTDENTAGTCIYSPDGKQWYVTNIGICRNGDLSSAANALYFGTDTVDSYYKITKLPVTAEELENAKVTIDSSTARDKVSKPYTQIAVSDDGTKIFLSANSTYYSYIDTADTEQGITSAGGAGLGRVIDVKWNENLKLDDNNNMGYFVTACSQDCGLYGVWFNGYGFDSNKNGRMFTARYGTSQTEPYTVAFDTNGSNYIVGDTYGNIHVSGAFTDTIANTIGYTILNSDQENKLPVKDVFAGKKAADGKNEVLAVASDGTISDVLLVDSAASSYQKASDQPALTAGNTLTVSVPYINTTAESKSVMIITAVYSDSKLEQVKLDNHVMTAETESSSMTQTVTLDENSANGTNIKVMVWDSSLRPLTDASTPFFK